MDQKTKKSKGNKRFSVIIVAYNLGNFIERAIKSVEEQTFTDYELIIVDDCSTDNTREIIKKAAEQYGNIKYVFHKENKRAGGARNTALDIAKGEYIVFLDGDDRLAGKNILKRIDKVIGDDETDVTYLGFRMEGTIKELVIPTPETCTKTYKAAADKYPNPWSKCWRREFLNENNIRFPENRFYEDVLFVYNGVMKSKTQKIADFVTHRYTSGRKYSMTTNINMQNVKDTIKNLEDLLVLREKEYTKEIDIILKKEIRMCKKRLDDKFSNVF